MARKPITPPIRLPANVAQREPQPLYLVPVTVTQVTPLLVTYKGSTNIPAVKLAGCTYSLGVANALLSSPGHLIVLPIG
jgi:hypothetical protein